MMKTLNDIQSDLIKNANKEKLYMENPFTLDGVLTWSNAQLRKEAIKWIKELDKQLNKEIKSRTKDKSIANLLKVSNSLRIGGKIEWIQNFFNIKESDL